MKIINEKILMNQGHTLSVIECNGGLIAYKGEVGFDGIEILTGDSMFTLKKEKQLFQSMRWATAINFKDRVHLFCCQNTGSFGSWRNQKILHYIGDGIDFKKENEMIDCSAPWPYIENGMMCLLYHKIIDGVHHIMKQNGSKPISVYSGINETVSAPSIYSSTYLLIEARKSEGLWKTQLLVKNWGSFRYQRTILRDRACAFFNKIREKLFVTYSCHETGRWDLRCSEVVFE